MSSGGQTPVTQTQTSTPWSGAQGHLTYEMDQANNLYTGNVGYQPYMGNLQAPESVAGQQGLASIYGLATANPGGAAWTGEAINQGRNALANQGLTSGEQQSLAQMQNQYNTASTQENPYLQATIAANDRRIGDRVNSAMSGAGRYGSGAHTDVMSRAMAESADPVLAQDYMQRQQLAQQLSGQMLGGYQAGGQNMGKWAQLLPALEEARYAPAQHMLDVGQYYENRSQQDIANQVAQYNAQQARPWEQLQRYAGITSGTGALGGTKVTSSNPYTPSTLQKIGGGALAGAGLGGSFGGPAGAGVGAGIGGLLGLL